MEKTAFMIWKPDTEGNLAVTTEFGIRNPHGYQRTLTADSSHLLKWRVPGTGLKVEGPVEKGLYVGNCSFISRPFRPK